MNDKFFFFGMLIIISGFLGVALFAPDPETKQRTGAEQADNGREHLALGETINYADGVPPTSGKHGNPLGWGEYPNPVPDENVIHDMEHGGIYISYNPEKVSDEDIASIRALFFEPYSNAEFAPTKVILAPRLENAYPIVFSSWNRNQIFEEFDELAMMEYYLTNVNKSPEIAG